MELLLRGGCVFLTSLPPHVMKGIEKLDKRCVLKKRFCGILRFVFDFVLEAVFLYVEWKARPPPKKNPPKSTPFLRHASEKRPFLGTPSKVLLESMGE